MISIDVRAVHNWSDDLDGDDRHGVALLSQLPRAVEHEPLKVVRRHMSIERRLIPILLPEREDVGLLLAPGHVKPDDAFFPTRSIAQFSQHRFGPLGICGSEGEMDRLNEHHMLLRAVPRLQTGDLDFSSKCEHIRLNAGIKKLDREGPVLDLTFLPNELVETRLSNDTGAVRS